MSGRGLRWRPRHSLYTSIVGREGKVIGTDTDREILALARADAEAANLGNIEFHEVDGCKSEWDQ